MSYISFDVEKVLNMATECTHYPADETFANIHVRFHAEPSPSLPSLPSIDG